MALATVLNENTGASYYLAVTYLLVACFAARKFYYVRKASGTWDTTTFFVGSILFACLVRCFAMASLVALSILKVSLADQGGGGVTSNTPVSRDASFYSKALEVLFNIGDFVTVSTYLSLVVVWVETFQHSRRHHYSETASRRNWMVAFLVFNATLYAGQICLYLLYFFWSSSEYFLNVIYITLASINLAVPFMLFVCWIWLNCAFSGFPFKSVADRDKWAKMSRMTMVWSLCRALFGGVAVASVGTEVLTTANVEATGSGASQTPLGYSMALVTVFLLSEVAPFLLALSSDLLTILAWDNYFFLYGRREVPSHRHADRAGGSMVTAARL